MEKRYEKQMIDHDFNNLVLNRFKNNSQYETIRLAREAKKVAEKEKAQAANQEKAE